MTSFSDEQPLSRRQRRERLRAQQAQDSVLQSKPVSETESSETPHESETPPETAAAARAPETPPEITPEKNDDSGAQAPRSEDETASGERPLTRRELRALRAETGATAVIPPSEDADSAKQASAPKEPSAPAVSDAPKPKTASSSADDEKQAPQKSKGAKLGIGRKKTEAKDKSNDSAEPQKPGPVTPPAAAEKKSESASELAHDVPKLSPTFGDGQRNTGDSPQRAAEAFDTLVAPEARASDVFTTSSVLILPGMPSRQTRTPAPGTGEIMVTGSVDLPKSKARDRESNAEHSDIDSGSDNSHESPATAGTPVSATRAVSTHAVTRDVITPPTKASSSKLLMILAITAGVLCVAVIGVVIVGLMTGQF